MLLLVVQLYDLTVNFDAHYCTLLGYAAKRSSKRAINGMFAKTGRLASEEVILQLILHKCMPIFYTVKMNAY